MIGFIRSLFDSWLGRIAALAFVVLVGFAFALSDVSSNLGGGVATSTIAKVGDTEISARDYRTALDNGHRQARQNNPELDFATFVRVGADGLLDKLVNSYAISEFGKANGFAASRRMVDAEIRKVVPGVVDSEGKFDAEAFRRTLADVNLTEAFLRKDIERSLLTEQLLGLSIFGLVVPDKMSMDYAAIQFESRSGTVSALPSPIFMPKTEPSPATLQSFYKENSDRYTIPEQRSVSYAIFTTDIVGDRAKPTDAEISTYYEENTDQFSARNEISYSQIILPTEAAANAALKKLTSGQSLATVAKDLGLDVSSSKAISEGDLAAATSAAVAKNVYATGKGGYAKPAKGDFGWHVVHVDDLKNVPARSLAQANDEIYTRLLAEKKEEAFADITEEMQDRLDEGDSLQDVAKAYALKVQTTPAVLPNGANIKDPKYRPIPEMQFILPAAFQMDADDAGQLVQIGKEERFALVSVPEITAAAPPKLSEIKPRVVADWQLSEGNKAAKVAGEQALKSIKSGKSMAASLKELQIQLPAPQTLRGTRQEIAQAGGQNMPPALMSIFNMPVDGARLIPIGQDRGYFLIKVVSASPAKLAMDDPRMQAFSGQFNGAFSSELEQQFVAAMRADIDVDINDSAVKTMKDELGGNT